MMVEQEILEAEKKQNNSNKNIKTSDLNSDSESISDSNKSERLLFRI